MGAEEGNTVSGWQPIETAPKQRTFILLYCPNDGSTWLAAWQGGDRWFGVDELGLRRDSKVERANLSHWMPLPAPPK